MKYPLSNCNSKADDYQDTGRPIAVMAKTLPHSEYLDPHSHVRDQFLYAVQGIMQVRTAQEIFIIPPDRGVYIPAGIKHSVRMRGRVEMRTLYIEPTSGVLDNPVMLDVSDLMRELILALLEEPIEYDVEGRGGLLSKLILHELSGAKHLSLAIKMPVDERLHRLCSALLEDPGNDQTLMLWGEKLGVSERTLIRLFKKELGLSFVTWRMRVRFQSAIEELLQGRRITRVAFNAGYNSASAFTAAFHKEMGLVPSYYSPKEKRPSI